MAESEVERRYEHGYRLPDGREVWEVDHGTDGVWTPFDREFGIAAIDMDVREPVESIRRGLEAAGVSGGTVLRRLVIVTRGEVEQIPTATIPAG